MTLCIAWRDDKTVHFASDSRLTIAKNSYADVGIKVVSLPYKILEPALPNELTSRKVLQTGELGMCFAGSVVSSLTIKESISEVLKNLQYIPGHTDLSMESIANLIFSAYKVISREICQTVIRQYGIANVIFGGACHQTKKIRVFQLSTNASNQASINEVLTNQSHIFIGQGAAEAESDTPKCPSRIDYLDILKSIINDTRFPGVGGHIQYGQFYRSEFIVHGILEQSNDRIHYWRGGLDLNEPEFIDDNKLIPSINLIDPYRTISGN